MHQCPRADGWAKNDGSPSVACAPIWAGLLGAPDGNLHFEASWNESHFMNVCLPKA